jgi:hypothetical protein
MNLRPIPITVERYETRSPWKTWAWIAAAVLTWLLSLTCIAFAAGAIYQRFFS